jgi:hypothetical protein
VVEFLGRRHFEAANLDALGVDAAHDVLDGAVLASGIESLKYHQKRVRVLSGEAFLVV